MKTHYDDNFFQEYLDNVIDNEAAANFRLHLNACPKCREALAEYQNLYNGMVQLETPALPENFAELTAKHILKKEKASNFFGLYEFLIIIGSFTVIIASIIYYGGSKYFTGFFSELTGGYGMDSLSAIGGLLSGGMTIPFIFIGGIILLFTAYFDQLILKGKHSLS